MTTSFLDRVNLFYVSPVFNFFSALQVKLEEFDAFVERLKDMIPFTALAPVDENAILVKKGKGVLVLILSVSICRNPNLCLNVLRLSVGK